MEHTEFVDRQAGTPRPPHSTAEPGSLVAGRRIPALNAIRGVAIGLVMLRHASPSKFGAGGFVGVELFFVLSGFLITGILRADIRGPGHRPAFFQFYRNRFLRLLPALVVMVGVVALVVTLVNPLHDRNSPSAGVITALTYTSDLPHWPLPQFTDITHLWTLAIEEQFYLVWPLALFLLALGHRTRKGAAWCLGIAAAASMFTVLFGVRSHELAEIYTWPTTWAVTLMLGCAFSVGVLRPRVSALGSTVMLLALCVVTLSPEAKNAAWGYLLLLPVVAVLGMFVIANAISEHPSGILQNRGLQYLGTISYGAYLWNYPLSLWVNSKLAVPLTIAVAAVSYKVVEQPFLRLKRDVRDVSSQAAPDVERQPALGEAVLLQPVADDAVAPDRPV